MVEEENKSMSTEKEEETISNSLSIGSGRPTSSEIDKKTEEPKKEMKEGRMQSLETLVVLLLFGNSILFFSIFLVAYSFPDKTVGFAINEYGEADIELITLAIFNISATYVLFRKYKWDVIAITGLVVVAIYLTNPQMFVRFYNIIVSFI